VGMRLDLLEADQVDQLSACSLSLLLGVFSHENKIERYLRLARAILNVENAAFSFHDEPYVWAGHADCDFQAYFVEDKVNFSSYFDGQLIISEGHQHYQTFSKEIDELGIKHKRLLYLDFRSDLNQGKIFVSSKEGKGTSFHVALPNAKNLHQTLVVNRGVNEVNKTKELQHP